LVGVLKFGVPDVGDDQLAEASDGGLIRGHWRVF
jgi:hypothetical protein